MSIATYRFSFCLIFHSWSEIFFDNRNLWKEKRNFSGFETTVSENYFGIGSRCRVCCPRRVFVETSSFHFFSGGGWLRFQGFRSPVKVGFHRKLETRPVSIFVDFPMRALKTINFDCFNSVAMIPLSAVFTIQVNSRTQSLGPKVKRAN